MNDMLEERQIVMEYLQELSEQMGNRFGSGDPVPVAIQAKIDTVMEVQRRLSRAR